MWARVAIVLVCAAAQGCAVSHVGPEASAPGSDTPVLTDAPLDACLARVETCDGDDDDCDGVVDEEGCALEGAVSRCVAASCVFDRCLDGRADCDGVAENGCEVDVSSDRQNCGGCDVECRVSEACQDGSCVRERIVDFDVGHNTIVVLESGRVVGWGHNAAGVLIPGAEEVLPLPIELTASPAAAEIEAMGSAMCLLDREGGVWCQGYNEEGACGTGSVSHSEPLTRVALPRPARTLSAGHYSVRVCAGLDDGTVWCWGTRCQRVPVPAPFRDAFLEGTEVADWSSPNMFRIEGDALLATGANHQGQLGLGTVGGGCSLDMTDPVRTRLPDGERVVRLHAGGLLALGASGHVLVWGDNESGRLGEGPDPVALPTTPHVIPGLPAAVSMGAGYQVWCALDEDGSVWCWGETGIAGLGYTPTRVEALSGVTRLEMAGAGSCVLIGDRSLRCWGENTHGQVGIGTTEEVNTPVAPLGFE